VVVSFHGYLVWELEKVALRHGDEEICNEAEHWQEGALTIAPGDKTGIAMLHVSTLACRGYSTFS